MKTKEQEVKVEQRQMWAAGDWLLCVDDQGWLVTDPPPGYVPPQKGCVYTLREYTREFGGAWVSLMEQSPAYFYRACRFKRVEVKS